MDAWMHMGQRFGLAWQIGEEGLALARQVGDRGLIAAALQTQGRILQRQGDLAKARELLEESLQLARAARTKHGLSRSLFFLASVLTQQGETGRAKPLWEESFRLSGELGGLLANFALRALVVQAPSREGALQMVEQAAAEYGPDVVGDALGALVVRAPSDEEAFQMIEQAVAEYGVGVVRGALGALVVRAPSNEEALRRIDWAAREYGPEAAIHPHAVLGHAARERGDYEGAATCYRRSLALRQEVGDTRGLSLSLADFAGLAARQQEWERAARLLGAAEGACVELKLSLPVPVPEGYKQAVEGARDALGEEAFAAAWAEGRALSLENAIQLALGASHA